MGTLHESRTILLFFVTLTIGACTPDDVDEPDGADAGISASCAEAANHSDLEWIQDNIFTTSCAASGACHQGAAAGANGLSLDRGASEAALVDVLSREDPASMLVVAGDPDSSYLLHILGRDPPASAVITRDMPLAAPLLCDEKVEAIARWVSSL